MTSRVRNRRWSVDLGSMSHAPHQPARTGHSTETVAAIPHAGRPVSDAIATADYLGFRIVVHSERLPDGSVRGSFAASAISGPAALLLEQLDAAALCSGPIEVAATRDLLDWAKCEIDFLLEEPY